MKKSTRDARPTSGRLRAGARSAVWFSALLLGGASCHGVIGDSGPGKGNSGTGTTTTGGGPGGGTGTGGGTGGSGGGGVMPPPPFEPVAARSTVRKVKNLLIGLAPTDDEVNVVATTGAAGLRTLITDWMAQPAFKEKMLFFFRGAFQQQGFVATEDFKMQLLTNGGFDINTGALGDDAFPRLVQNLEDSFALTAWQLIADGRPFTEVLTTQKFMMTTGLKSLYAQIEMPNDARVVAAMRFTWKVDHSGTPIPLEDTINPASPNYLVFSDEPPVVPPRTQRMPACQGMAGVVYPHTTYARLFQRLLGGVPDYNDPTTGTTICAEHAARPYFTTQDLSDWQWVTIRPLNAGETKVVSYDLPTLRASTELALSLPRVGFYTTPSFLALWNTNDSNQHRVTANQTLLVALGASYTPENMIVPLSTAGLDANHAVTGTDCYGCHVSLDPMRQFWATQLDFNDRNDFPPRAGGGLAANPRPATIGGAFAFGNVNTQGANMLALGPLLGQVAATDSISRFAISFAQKLCFFANSAACSEDDPEFRRIASVFQNSNYDFLALIKEVFTSPLVTAASETLTFTQTGVTVSVSRRDQLCGALSNRLGIGDLCALYVPVPSTAQAATSKIATSVAADTFSRGAESPVTPSDPTLFYRSASELLCENVSLQAVDGAGGTSLYKSANLAGVLEDMVVRLMGYPPSDPRHAQAVQILQGHYDAAVAAKNTVTNALRSTFTLACESPTALSIGL